MEGRTEDHVLRAQQDCHGRELRLVRMKGETAFIAIAISDGDIKLVKDVFTKEEDARKYVERNKEACLKHQGLALVYIERVLNPKGRDENELD